MQKTPNSHSIPSRSHRVFACPAILSIALIALMRTDALASGRRVGVRPTDVFVHTMMLMPGTQYRIETRNLVQPSDTVLHVQASNGAYLAGNDNCPGETSTRSCVTINPTNAPRKVFIVVRAASDQTGGHGTLRVRGICGLPGCSPSQQDISIPWFGGVTVNLGEHLRAGNRVLTVRERNQSVFRGALDTVVIVRKSATVAVAFDDEGGPRASPEHSRGMAKATVTSECLNCVVTIGTVRSPLGHATGHHHPAVGH